MKRYLMKLSRQRTNLNTRNRILRTIDEFSHLCRRPRVFSVQPDNVPYNIRLIVKLELLKYGGGDKRSELLEKRNGLTSVFTKGLQSYFKP